MQLFVVAPPAAERISGGHLYNQQLAEHGTRVTLVSLAISELAQRLHELTPEPGAWIIADSLFLHPQSLAPFLELRQRRSCRLAMLLHALPSFVTLAAASDTKPPTAPVPSALELGLLEQLDLVVCPGPYLPRLLCGAGARVPYVICPPGTVKRSPRVRPKALEGPLRLLSVGNLTRGKGFRDGLLALSRLQDLDWEWELVGSRDWDAEFACELDELANSLGLTKRVHFLGQLEHHQTLERYQNNQLFLLPSYSENYPLVLLEAQAHSLPVVAYDVAGVPDIVQHDVSGLLAAPFDTDALGRCLEQLLKSRALRQRYGAAAHAAASERPEWREASELFERRLLDLPGPAAPAT